MSLKPNIAVFFLNFIINKNYDFLYYPESSHFFSICIRNKMFSRRCERTLGTKKGQSNVGISLLIKVFQERFSLVVKHGAEHCPLAKSITGISARARWIARVTQLSYMLGVIFEKQFPALINHNRV